MSNFLFLRSKSKLSKDIILKINDNLKNKYLKKEKKILFFKSKKFNYHFILNFEKNRNIFKKKKTL